MKRSLLWAAVATIACAVAASSCKPEAVSVTGVTLDKSTLSLTEGESATLKATVKPDDAENKAIAWKSEKPAVATVDQTGKVTAVKEGSATIVVTTADGGKTASCTVTVKAKSTPPPPPPVISIDTQPTAPRNLTEGEIPSGTRLSVEASVTEGATLKYQWYIWDNANNKVGSAVAGATGKNFTISSSIRAGEHWYVCKISAEGAETKFTTPVKVTVTAKPVEPPTLAVKPGVDLSIRGMTVGIEIDAVDVSAALAGGKKPYTFSATGLPAGLSISPAGVISGKPTTVMSTGTVTVTVSDGSSPAQTLTITIPHNGVSASFRPVTNITGVPNATIGGIDLELTGTVAPANATHQRILWSVKSDGGSGATIADGSNVLKTLTGGTIVVTATVLRGQSPSRHYRKDFTIVATTPTNEVIFGGENEEDWP